MGVRVIERLYTERFTDGSTDWLLGNVGDWQKGIFTVEVSIEFNATQQEPIAIDKLNNIFEISSGKNWGDFGFDIGMNVNFSYLLSEDTTGDGNLDQETVFTETYEIINLFANKMVVDKAIDVDDFTNIPLNFGRKKISEVRFYTEEEPEGCKLQYTHLTNEDKDSQALTSFIDSTTTEFILPDIKSVPNGVWKNMTAIGFQSGMSIKSARVRKLEGSGEDTFVTWNGESFTNSLFVVNYFGSSNTYYRNTKTLKLITAPTPLNYIQSVSSSYEVPIGTSSGSTPLNGNTAHRFIKNVPTNVSHDIFISVNFRVPSTQRVNNTNKLQLVLIRYTNNDAMNYAETIVLKTWNEVDKSIGVNLVHSGIVNRNMLIGESYVLAFMFTQDSYSNSGNPAVVALSVDDAFVELSQPNQNLVSGARKRYQFEIKYLISSYFDTIQNFQNKEIPEFLKGDGSLTDNFRFNFYPEWNNPNVVIQNILQETVRLGNTGWFDENFNQLPNDFKVESVDYFDENGNRVESLDYFSKTKVKAVISGVKNLNSLTECGFGFAWIPLNEEDYRDKETPFYQNIFVQSGDTNDGFRLDNLSPGPYTGAGINGGSMDAEGIKFSKSGDNIVFEGFFVPNSSFFSIFERKDSDDRNYILYFSVADGSLKRNFSDRVTLLGDFNSMIKTIPPAGKYPYIENAFLTHPERVDATGTDKLKAITQDDVLCRMPFRIKKSEDISFNSMTFGVEMFNLSTEKSFVLDSFDVDVSQSKVDSEGVQQFDFFERRNFILDATNNKNWVKIEKNNSLDTVDFSGFLALFAFRIRWEDWLIDNEAPAEFFNSEKENNGQNKDWYDYLIGNGWQINFFTLINANKDGYNILYKNQFKFDFVDYDKNENIEVTHNYFRDSDNQNLNVGTDQETGRPLGVILNNENTRIEISFRILDSGTFDPNNVFSQITIEIDKGAGSPSMRMLSSVWDSESNNPLKAIDGGKRLTFVVDPTNKILTASCLVDSDLLEDGSRYRISGRVGCGNGDDEGFNTGLYEFRYENKYE